MIIKRGVIWLFLGFYIHKDITVVLLSLSLIFFLHFHLFELINHGHFVKWTVLDLGIFLHLTACHVKWIESFVLRFLLLLTSWDDNHSLVSTQNWNHGIHKSPCSMFDQCFHCFTPKKANVLNLFIVEEPSSHFYSGCLTLKSRTHLLFPSNVTRNLSFISLTSFESHSASRQS